MKLNEIVITKIHNLTTISSPSGKTREMKNRKYYGLSFCIKGQITYTQNGKQYISNNTNAVLLPKGGYYSLISNKDGLFPIINFDCKKYFWKENVYIVFIVRLGQAVLE